MELPIKGDAEIFKEHFEQKLLAVITNVESIKDKDGEIIKSLEDKWKISVQDITAQDSTIVKSKHSFLWWHSSLQKLKKEWGDSDKWIGKTIQFNLIENGIFVNERGVAPQ